MDTTSFAVRAGTGERDGRARTEPGARARDDDDDDDDDDRDVDVLGRGRTRREDEDGWNAGTRCGRTSRCGSTALR